MVSGAARLRRRALSLGQEARRAGFIALGCLMLFLGVVGAFLPLMPTTIFLILAAWCFGHSSPRFEAWTLDHPRFGPVLCNWREHGTMPRRAKVIACSGMAFGYALFWFSVALPLWLALAVAALTLGCAIWIVRRPELKRPTTKPEIKAGHEVEATPS